MNTPVLCKGIVIREVAYGESDKCLTVLTDTLGCVPVFCKGAKSYKSKFFVSAQLFCYSELELYSRADRYWLKECSLIENFYKLREDVAAFALAQYFCDVVGDVTRENLKEPEILQLLLNALFVLTRAEKPLPLIKGVFEMRLCSLAGFRPDLVGCAVCGQYGDGTGMRMDFTGGQIFCSRHKGGAPDGAADIAPEVVSALRYAVFSPPQRIFAFELASDALDAFSRVAERYLLCQLDRSFRTLEFYHSVEQL